MTDFGHVEWEGAVIQHAGSAGAQEFRVFMPAGEKAAWIARFEAEGVVAAGPDDARTVRLEHGVPRYGEDIFETTLPQETRQMHAVHFAKGCYLGQEIVERIRSRGHVNKLLVSLEVDGDTPVASGSKIVADRSDVGEITSSAFSPALGKMVALGYARAQYAGEGAELTVAGRAAKVRSNQG